MRSELRRGCGCGVGIVPWPWSWLLGLSGEWAELNGVWDGIKLAKVI